MLASAIPRTSSLPFWECRASEPESHFLARGLADVGHSTYHFSSAMWGFPSGEHYANYSALSLAKKNDGC
jgi:hypothetical protein